ncbi:alanine racemase [Clostridium saccharobutylicum]|uniref:Alanine racemase n=1 Tax=Clostridium saccharobutylicum DSM 13864 TaxID=1345695 RepID=U5MTY5_CLOSA|nr:alanine racemase [Clostridium saccharobutylicum]AGX44055.1 alanine racemase Alr [Clostridium saccharobutylicum DSM 13864]AQR91347.1 alanine racemase [Clostridium saccharobutylicum]AQS01251.1 alanine racemase [Clostridium saccharobutylicum]AQS10861.1 alanine racemase [Clostridium saccharobutylicum]AQS15234.1 alanine racemase [Clostridium saccharobutylicum]
MEKYFRSYARIDLDAISHNINEVKKRIGHGVKVMAVIKADGYGHGATVLGDFLKNEVDYYGVATIEEAMELREYGIKVPILILGYTSPSQYLTLVENDITQTVYNIEMAKEMSNAGEKCKKQAKIHIALDTGMTRIGFQPNEDGALAVKEIATFPSLNIEGLFTHFACADEKDKSYSELQIDRYDKFVELLEEKDINIPIKHMCNSAGIMEFDHHRFDMVRSGIITYGLYPSEDVNKDAIKLKPALQWKTHVVNVKNVDSGHGVSYGATYITKNKTKIATISIGYADGYPRALSSKAKVLIHGSYAPIIGRVCMDQMMIDVTNIDNVEIEDEVTLVGQDGRNAISVEELADIAGSFNYEFVCGIGKRVPRVYEGVEQECI